MLLSVIIPTCHRNDLLALCLDALKPEVQTLSKDYYEVIVTDDGSKSTAEELISISYKWVKWVQGPRKGPAANRNFGAANAHGQWLVFIDDDCIPDSDLLSAYKRNIENKALINVFEGKIICKIGVNSPLYQAPINTEGGNLWSCNMAVKKAYFDYLKGFETYFPYPNMEDVHFKDKILADNNQFVFVPEAVVDHPPRKMSNPSRQSSMHESWFLYWSERGRKNVKIGLLIEIIKFRIGGIKNSPFSSDSVVAFFWMIQELLLTTLKSFNWSYKK